MKICENPKFTMPMIKLLTVGIDYISIVMGLLTAYHLRVAFSWMPVHVNFELDSIYTFLIIPLVFIGTLFINNGYNIDMPYWDKIKHIFRSITIGVVVSIVLMYAGHVTNDVSRLFVGFTYIFILFFCCCFAFHFL